MPFDSPAPEFVKFEETGRLTGDYTGRYKNQLRYMDWIITSLLDTLAELGQLDQTLVIITNDHGEMLGGDDGGLLGHGWNLKPVLVNTPLIILNPLAPGSRTNFTLGAQVDVLPTVLDLLQLPPPPGELYQGVSLYDAAANAGKVIYFNSYQDRALVTGDKYFLKPAGAPATVFSVRNEGVKTIFEPTGEITNVTARLELFERFQNAFIVHYSHYKQEFRQTTTAR